MNKTPTRPAAGHTIYSPRILRVYDWFVLGLSNRLIWKCPTRRLARHYDRHVTGNHLDVGIGTGYFLDKCRFPTPSPRVALMDLNRNSLDFTSRRIARYTPEIYRCDLLEPISMEMGKFDSVGVNYLLHCLPGSIGDKAIIFDHLKPLMNPHAVIFGATLLQGSVQRNWAAKRLMAVYNHKGIFSNRHDDLDGLKQALSRRFKDVSIEIAGCAALFSGRV
ncbi:class I SAM-dependent methyltransferase [Methylohalobius crimeensis]|uniref:class I SAM-dependent methyltransferase n=1 Tax=Methylohalobius crimeensis TaxID=244365 RepID=UPI0003B61594|nr:class I SAM-dependent methyltransferase [Methylohalobius crimeensis]